MAPSSPCRAPQACYRQRALVVGALERGSISIVDQPSQSLLPCSLVHSVAYERDPQQVLGFISSAASAPAASWSSALQPLGCCFCLIGDDCFLSSTAPGAHSAASDASASQNGAHVYEVAHSKSLEACSRQENESCAVASLFPFVATFEFVLQLLLVLAYSEKC